MTVSISDMTVPPEKPGTDQAGSGDCRPHHKELQTWSDHRKERYKEVVGNTGKKPMMFKARSCWTDWIKYNNIFMMASSGARGSDKQIKQLADITRTDGRYNRSYDQVTYQVKLP